MTTILLSIRSFLSRFSGLFKKNACMQDFENKPLSNSDIEVNELFKIKDEINFLNEMLFDDVLSVENLPEPAFSLRESIIELNENMSTWVGAREEISVNLMNDENTDEHTHVLYRELVGLIRNNAPIIKNLNYLFSQFIDGLDTDHLPDALIDRKGWIVNARLQIARLEKRRTSIEKFVDALHEDALALQL